MKTTLVLFDSTERMRSCFHSYVGEDCEIKRRFGIPAEVISSTQRFIFKVMDSDMRSVRGLRFDEVHIHEAVPSHYQESILMSEIAANGGDKSSIKHF